MTRVEEEKKRQQRGRKDYSRVRASAGFDSTLPQQLGQRKKRHCAGWADSASASSS